MKTSLNIPRLAVIRLVASLCVSFFGLSVADAAGGNPLLSAPVRPGLDYRSSVSQGYLVVYSATDRIIDGDVQYYPHSSYAIYTLDGKLLKTVANRVSDSDEAPDIVALPAGSYLIEARSEEEGFLRVHIMIRAGVQTALNLEGKWPANRVSLVRAADGREKEVGD
jgi:hypothetical protein